MQNIVVFSSRSGSDAIFLSNYIFESNFPYKIKFFVTNNSNSPLISYGQLYNIEVKRVPFRPEVEDYEKLKLERTDLILLMGYLRIIPEWMCKEFIVYNLHPGNIEKYPELKGIHPQKKAIERRLRDTGCVIHRVDREVDEGKVVISSRVDIFPEDTEDSLIDKLSVDAKNLWIKFLINLKKGI